MKTAPKERAGVLCASTWNVTRLPTASLRRNSRAPHANGCDKPGAREERKRCESHAERRQPSADEEGPSGLRESSRSRAASRARTASSVDLLPSRGALMPVRESTFSGGALACISTHDDDGVAAKDGLDNSRIELSGHASRLSKTKKGGVATEEATRQKKKHGK